MLFPALTPKRSHFFFFVISLLNSINFVSWPLWSLRSKALRRQLAVFYMFALELWSNRDLLPDVKTEQNQMEENHWLRNRSELTATYYFWKLARSFSDVQCSWVKASMNCTAFRANTTLSMDFCCKVILVVPVWCRVRRLDEARSVEGALKALNRLGSCLNPNELCWWRLG